MIVQTSVHLYSKYIYYYDFKLSTIQDLKNIEKLKHYAFTSAILANATKESLDDNILHSTDPAKFNTQAKIQKYYKRHVGKTYKNRTHSVGYTNLGIVDIDESSTTASSLFKLLQDNNTNILALFPSYSQRHLPPEECTKMRILYIRPHYVTNNSVVVSADREMPLAEFQVANKLSSLPLWEHYKELYAKEMVLLGLPPECKYDESFLKLSQHSKPVLDPKDNSWTLQPDQIRPLYEVEGGHHE